MNDNEQDGERWWCRLGSSKRTQLLQIDTVSFNRHNGGDGLIVRNCLLLFCFVYLVGERQTVWLG